MVNDLLKSVAQAFQQSILGTIRQARANTGP